MEKRPSHKLRRWAYKNAYTLTFLSIMFIITWALVAFLAWYYGPPHH